MYYSYGRNWSEMARNFAHTLKEKPGDQNIIMNNTSNIVYFTNTLTLLKYLKEHARRTMQLFRGCQGVKMRQICLSYKTQTLK